MIKFLKKKAREFYEEVFVYWRKSKSKWTEEELIAGLMDVYERNHGYRFDIKNPVTFTEKVQWYKLYFKREGIENVVDKALFKKYIDEKIGEGNVIPMYNYWTSFKQFKTDWKNLPETFVLKATLSSDSKGVKIIKKKSETDFKKVEKEIKLWFDEKRSLINSYCSAYYNATPGVLAEEYMEEADGQLPDYKFMCFSGKPFCAYVIKNQFKGSGNRRFTFYDLEWNVMDVRYGKSIPEPEEKPKHFDEMLKCAEILSKDFPFVRVDFFDTDKKFYVAELTLYPGGGLYPFNPMEFNKHMGDLFVLPEDK